MESKLGRLLQKAARSLLYYNFTAEFFAMATGVSNTGLGARVYYILKGRRD